MDQSFEGAVPEITESHDIELNTLQFPDNSILLTTHTTIGSLLHALFQQLLSLGKIAKIAYLNLVKYSRFGEPHQNITFNFPTSKNNNEKASKLCDLTIETHTIVDKRTDSLPILSDNLSTPQTPLQKTLPNWFIPKPLQQFPTPSVFCSSPLCYS